MILVRCKGGLGNQLFQYAAGRALAQRHRVPLRLDDRWYASSDNQVKAHRSFDLAHFRVAGGMASDADRTRFGLATRSRPGRALGRLRRLLSGRRVWVNHEMGYHQDFERLGPHTCIEGFFQHPRYFSSITPTLRDELQLREPPPDHIRALAGQLSAVPAVCVQVRRTDYIAHADAADLHGVCDADYYRRAWAELTRRIPDAQAWIFTDDAAWAREHLRELRPVRIIQDELGGEPFLGKFFVMQACRHFISANSTFGWWAAWLGAHQASIVIVPRAWLRGRDVDELGLRLPGWLAC